MKTLIIPHDQVAALININELRLELIDGFKSYSDGTSRRDGQRIVLNIQDGNKATLLGPGTSAGIPAFSVKTNSKYPGQAKALKGVISLFDIETGDLLALLDSALITAVRTGLCAAIATNALADPNMRRVTVIGAGRQNRLQLGYLLNMRTIEQVTVFDVSARNAERFKREFEDRTVCEIAKSLPESLDGAEIILTATWTKTPILTEDMVPQRCHITSLGSDEKGKVELAKNLVLSSSLYCDDVSLNMMMGTPGNLELSEDCIAGELGQVLSTPEELKKQVAQRTIYSCVGLPFQDLVTAWHVYNKALASENGVSLEMN